MFAVYEILAQTEIIHTSRRAHFIEESMAREWATLKAKKEFKNTSFIVIDLASGELKYQSQGHRLEPKPEEKSRTILEGRVDLQA